MGAVFDYPQPASANCTDIVTLYLSSAPLNIVTDLVILLLPIPVIKSMRLPTKQKIILHVTFGFGLFVAVVDVVRISFLQEASVTKLEDVLSGQVSNASRRNQERSDFSWYAAYTFLWSAVEVNIGICCASVPALKPLASAVLPQMIRDTIQSAPETPKRDASGATKLSRTLAFAHYALTASPTFHC